MATRNVIRALAAGFVLAMGAQAWAQTPPVTGAAPQQTTAGPAQRGGRGQTPVPGSQITNQQIQELFDSLELTRVQPALRLTDAEYLTLIPKLRALQILRRQHRMQRQRALRELGGLVNPNAQVVADDASIVAKVKALDDLEIAMEQNERQAVVAIDQVLTVRQRAHFRVFEERMESDKINLLVRAQLGAPKTAPSGQPDKTIK